MAPKKNKLQKSTDIAVQLSDSLLSLDDSDHNDPGRFLTAITAARTALIVLQQIGVLNRSRIKKKTS